MTLDPRTWPADEVANYLELNKTFVNREPKSGSSKKGVVVGSTGPFAQLAGRKTLEAGGTAVDAALTTALAQICLAYGSWVSYAGIITLVHYDATTGKVESMSGGYRTFLEEDDPMTIPAAPVASGRTALTPGFFAGTKAAHDKFGKLPWRDLFEPALFLAEEGFPIGAVGQAHFNMRKDLLLNSPEGRELFAKPDGTVPIDGDVLEQPILAKTLRRVATEGTDHVYKGEWAEKFVELVRREGGKATMDDLRNYEVVWSEPLYGEIGPYVLAGLAAPDTGGAALIEGLNLADLAGVDDPTTSAESLFWLINIARQNQMLTSAPPQIRVTKEYARDLWRQMQNAGKFVPPRVLMDKFRPGSHSDFVCAADEEGNVVAVCHSINTSLWGTTGIFVDGISIPDAACFQQQVVAQAGPGKPLPNPTNPAIVLKDGKPFLASSSIGAGLLEVTLQCVSAVLQRGESAADAVRKPHFHYADWTMGDSITDEVKQQTTGETRRAGVQELMKAEQESGTDPMDVYPNVLVKVGQVVEDTFDASVLKQTEDLGQLVTVKPWSDPAIPRGYWAGIQIDQETGEKLGAHTGFVNGTVETT